MNDSFYKSETITFCAACFSGTAVIIAIILSIYFYNVNSSQLYYSTIQQCVEARGTWVPTISAGACVINNNIPQ